MINVWSFLYFFNHIYFAREFPESYYLFVTVAPFVYFYVFIYDLNFIEYNDIYIIYESMNIVKILS